jgi:hypothetical protein
MTFFSFVALVKSLVVMVNRWKRDIYGCKVDPISESWNSKYPQAFILPAVNAGKATGRINRAGNWQG